MPSAANNAFAARMAAKPPCESLNSDPAYRIFYDPPELIQMAFGGRPWFFETGCVRVHRIGLFKGLGWELDPMLLAQSETEATGVRILARQYRRDKAQLFDVEFVKRELPTRESYDGQQEADYGAPVSIRIVNSRMGLTADQLRTAYGEVFGEHVL